MFRQEEEEYTRTSKGARTPRSVQEGSSKNHRAEAEAEAVVVRDQSSPSLGFLQSAENFEINDGSIASIGGDSFNARRDMYVTINLSPPSSSSSSACSSVNASVTSLDVVDEYEKERLRLREAERFGEMPSTSASASLQSTGSSSSSSRCCCGRRLGHEHGHIDTFILPPPPLQRSCDIYRRHLAPKGRGIPLWIPGLSKNLPIQYQRNGISIGDVGIVTESGSFIFLFSICLPRDHPINPPVMPEGFEPLGKETMQMFNVDVQRVFEENSYLASASSVRARRDGGSTGLIFESSEHDGAILTMPVGSKSEDLVNKARFQKYVKKNLKSWYQYAYHVRDFEVRNGDLRVVTGCDKTSAWGMATFFNSEAGCSGPNSSSSSRQDSDSLLGGGEPKFHLEFGLIENGTAPSEGRVKRYGWECSGMAEVRAGPGAREVLELRGGDVEEEDAVYENQCLFVRTLNATLPEKVWEELGFEEEEEEEEEEGGFHENENEKSVGGSNRASSSSSSSGRKGNASGGSSAATFSSSSLSKTQLSASRSITRKDSIANDYNAASVYSSLMSLVDHPSIAINDLLLKNCSDDTTMAITLDEDWMSVLREDDFVLPSSDELLERIMETYTIREEDGVVFLDSKCVDEGQRGSASFAILGVDEASTEEGEVGVPEKSPITVDPFGLLDALANLDPSLSNCADILTSTYHQLQNVKVHRDKCKDLYDRSSRLLLELQGLEDKAPDIFDDADAVIMDIYNKVGEWGSWNKMKSILRQGEIKQDIERLFTKVDMASTRFSVLRNLEVLSKFKGARERDKAVIPDGEEEEVDVQHTINSIFTAMEGINKARCRRLSGKALPSRRTLLPMVTPPMPTPQRSTTWNNSDFQDTGPSHMLGKGSFNKIHKSDYWNTETVSAIRRTPCQSYGYPPGIERRGGAVEMGDRKKLLDDFASDLEYLHKRGNAREKFRNADLRAANIAVKSEGVVRLSDFGMSKTLEEDGERNLRRGTGSLTFMAPELILGARDPELVQTDAWAFRSLALALLDDRGSVLRDKSNARREQVHHPIGSLQRCIDAIRLLEGKALNQDPDRKLRRPLPADDSWDIGEALNVLAGENYRASATSDYVSYIQRHPPVPSEAESGRSSIENLVTFSKTFIATTTNRRKRVSEYIKDADCLESSLEFYYQTYNQRRAVDLRASRPSETDGLANYVVGVDEDSHSSPDFDWSRHLPSAVPLDRKSHDSVLDLLSFSSWPFRVVPGLFLGDMYRALSVPVSHPALKTPHYSPMLHNALVALALPLLDEPRFRDPKNRQYFADTARSYIDVECQKPNLSVVQALSILASFHCSLGEHNLGHMYFGMSARMAQACLDVDSTVRPLNKETPDQCQLHVQLGVQPQKTQNFVLDFNLSSSRPDVKVNKTCSCGLPAGPGLSNFVLRSDPHFDSTKCLDGV